MEVEALYHSINSRMAALGRSLFERLHRKSEELPRRMMLGIAIQVAEGMQHLHTRRPPELTYSNAFSIDRTFPVDSKTRVGSSPPSSSSSISSESTCATSGRSDSAAYGRTSAAGPAWG